MEGDRKKSKVFQSNRLLAPKDFQLNFYSLLFEHYPDAIFILDRNGHFLATNQVAEDIIGYKPMELNRTIQDVVKPEYWDFILTHYHLTLEGVPQNLNIEAIHKKGHVVYLNLTNIPIKVNNEIIGVYSFAKDLTNLHHKEAELLKITNHLNLAQEVARIGSWDYDVESNHVYCSDPLYAILGINKIEGAIPLYENLLEMIFPEDRDTFDRLFQHTKQTGSDMELEYRIQKPDQSIITVHVKGVAKKDISGKVIRIIGILYDISDRVRTENLLKESEEKFETIAANIDVGIWSLDVLTDQLIYISPATEKITGYKLEDFLSGQMKWFDLIHQQDLKNYIKYDLIHGKLIQQQYRINTSEGKEKWVEVKTFPIINSDGLIIRLDGLVQDISERKQHEEQIKFFAYHDHLTELPNSRLFNQKLEQLIAKEDKFALYYLDMDRFKFVNDTLGHEIGDILLQEISKRLSSVAGENMCFRVGGDEFKIIQQNISAKDPLTLGKELIGEIEKPFKIEGYELHLTTSIGISIFPNDGDAVKSLKMHADAALYRAKELGKNNVQLFTPSLNSETYKMYTLENDLRKAIQRDEFILHYQPRVDTVTKEVVGAEALIRWNHPKWGVVSPCEFIPLAEETGFINEISHWVLQQVCQQLHEWRTKGYQPVPISINLSAKTLMRADLVLKTKEKLSKYLIPPSLIEVEITEDSLIKTEGTALSSIQMLRDLGIPISIDDFGTGFSSISYLKKFKVDYIKIDRSFINDLQEFNGDYAIVESIILLAKGFHLKVVAEGVEREDQWKLLKSLNCHYIQGYLFSKPVLAEQFQRFLLPIGKEKMDIN